MLVLTRKINESVQVGDNIRIIVSQIDNNKVKLVFDAPKDVTICRTEIIETRKSQ